MFLLGLTGGIATGKSTVSSQLKCLRCPIIDADLIAREVVEPGRPAWKKIKAHFGNQVINDDGTLNRPQLGQIIFSNEAERKKLNAITHPEIYKAMIWNALCCMFKGYQFAVMDLPLLFESGKMIPLLSYIVVVKCSKENQIQRLMARNNLSEEEAQQRINAQMSLDEKCKRATVVIDNDGSIEETKEQVNKLVMDLRSSKRHWILRISILATVYAIYSFACYIFGATNWLTVNVPFVGYIQDKIYSFWRSITEMVSF